MRQIENKPVTIIEKIFEKIRTADRQIELRVRHFIEQIEIFNAVKSTQEVCRENCKNHQYDDYREFG